MSFSIPISWQEGDPAWVRGRRVHIVVMCGGGGVLVRSKSGDHLLVHRRDLELPPIVHRDVSYAGGGQLEVRS